MLSFSAGSRLTSETCTFRGGLFGPDKEASKIFERSRWYCMKAHESDENLKTLHSVPLGKQRKVIDNN